MVRRKRCTECVELGATLERRDAAENKHWFHPNCWQAFCAWLRGVDPERCARYQSGELVFENGKEVRACAKKK